MRVHSIAMVAAFAGCELPDKTTNEAQITNADPTIEILNPVYGANIASTDETDFGHHP